MILTNNPASNPSRYNPAYCAINNNFIRTWVVNQANANVRFSKLQQDGEVYANAFLKKQNIGFHVGSFYEKQKNYSTAKYNLGIGYHLLFFNEVSVSFGVAVSRENISGNFYLNPLSNTDTSFFHSNKQIYYNTNLGILFCYDRLSMSFSHQPNKLTFNKSHSLGPTFNNTFALLKYFVPITRKQNAVFYYTYNNTTINNFSSDSISTSRNLSHQTLQLHLNYKAGLAFGFGFRSNLNQYNAPLAKLGYITSKIVIVYGAELQLQPQKLFTNEINIKFIF